MLTSSPSAANQNPVLSGLLYMLVCDILDSSSLYCVMCCVRLSGSCCFKVTAETSLLIRRSFFHLVLWCLVIYLSGVQFDVSNLEICWWFNDQRTSVLDNCTWKSFYFEGSAWCHTVLKLFNLCLQSDVMHINPASASSARFPTRAKARGKKRQGGREGGRIWTVSQWMK